MPDDAADAIAAALRIACEQDPGIDPVLLDDLPAMVWQLVARNAQLRELLAVWETIGDGLIRASVATSTESPGYVRT